MQPGNNVIQIEKLASLSSEAISDLEEFYPMENFSLVSGGIYRSAFPKKRNFGFLKKLGLKSILTLILEDYPELNTKFLDENNIQLFQFGVAGNKEPFVDIPEDKVRDLHLLTRLDLCCA